MSSLNPGIYALSLNNSGHFAWGASNFGPTNNGGEHTFNQPVYFGNSNSSNFVTLKAPATPGNVTLTLPKSQPTYGINALVTDSNGQMSFTNNQYNSVVYQPSNAAPFQSLNNVAKLSGMATTGTDGKYTLYFTSDRTSNGSNLFSTVTSVPKPTAFLKDSMTTPSQFPEIAVKLNSNNIVFTSFVMGGNLQNLGSTIVGGGPGLITSNQPFSWDLEGLPSSAFTM